jgi:hypothetical protein
VDRPRVHDNPGSPSGSSLSRRATPACLRCYLAIADNADAAEFARTLGLSSRELGLRARRSDFDAN